MPATKVDLIFVIDSSASMAPCLEGLVNHIEQLVSPGQGLSLDVRFGLVSHSVGKSVRGGDLMRMQTLGGSCTELYTSASQSTAEFFTRDANVFKEGLRKITPEGDENSLIALDIALDHPFEPSSQTRRVVALFSDETIEDGAVSPDQISQIPALIEKIHARRIKLFAAIPLSQAAEQLAEADGSEIEPVEGGDGLAKVDFGKLLSQMAKSISVTSLQTEKEAGFTRALFGQDKWVVATGGFSESR